MTRPKQPFKEDVKDMLSLHAGERRGYLVMMFVLLVLASIVIYVQWIYKPPPTDLEPLRKEMEAWIAARDAVRSDGTMHVEPFPFDPNTIERADWLALGLSEKQIDGLERYMSKGGRFRVKNDLGKMYSIRPEQFERLKPFIMLPDSLPKRTYERDQDRSSQFADRQQHVDRPPEGARPAFAKVELNTADSVALVAVPGIGPSFARGILKYRESLGGYSSLDQLAEVYILKDKPDAVVRLKELLVLDTLMVRRIPINTCTVEELAAHPYCRWKLAKPLIAYRTLHGPFRTVADIRGCAVIDEALFRKLAPYLSVE